MKLGILFSDASLLALDKPAGMLSVPGRGEHKQDCAATRAQAQFTDALVVHRLDMATSGLLLMALGAEMQRRLSRAFARREVRKRYVALVSGRVRTSSGAIDWPLAADWPNRPMQKVDLEHGKPALTHYQVLDYDAANDTTRLALEPVTGRSHQLRVHLLALGHPIVGDALYVPGASGRLMLHASELGLVHPTTGEPLQLTSAPPF